MSLSPRISGLCLLAGLIITTPALADGLYDKPVTGLTAVQDSNRTQIFRKEGVDFKSYASVKVEAPVYRTLGRVVEKDQALDKVPDRERKLLSDRFTRALTDRLEEDRAVTATAGAGTLVVTPVIGQVRANRTPYSMREPSKLLADIYGVGGATTALEVTDGKSGVLLMVIAIRFDGDTFDYNNNLWTFWGDAEEAFRLSARRLQKELGPAAKQS